MRVAIAGGRGTKQSTFICDVRLCLQSRPYLHLVPSGHTVSGALRASGLSESVKVYPSGHPPSDALRASEPSGFVKVYKMVSIRPMIAHGTVVVTESLTLDAISFCHMVFAFTKYQSLTLGIVLLRSSTDLS